ncbi:uncharacterized protein BDV14DRAFT_124067 [Aspergillus stella-maris]|uniref:uncharacterized protein n=1 Tax=Aspergillus stella-maris TaxID=1810926 RepID=UPI003CCDA388
MGRLPLWSVFRSYEARFDLNYSCPLGIRILFLLYTRSACFVRGANGPMRYSASTNSVGFLSFFLLLPARPS